MPLFAVVRLLLHAPRKSERWRLLSHRSAAVPMWVFDTSRNDVQGGSALEYGLTYYWSAAAAAASPSFLQRIHVGIVQMPCTNSSDIAPVTM